MNQNNKKYPTYNHKGKGKLIVTKEVKKKIDQLHSEIGNTEWCGFIFYEKIAGSISDPDTYVAKTTDVYLMGIGTHSYTESENHSDDILNMVDRVPAYMENRYGLIHTHHTMDTFFSGTDIQELHDNAANYSYYLSLIVNFKEDYSAKIAKLVEVKGASFDLDEEDEETVSMEFPVEHILMQFDLDVIIEGVKCDDEIITERIAEINKRKEEEKKAKLVKTKIKTGTFTDPEDNKWFNTYHNQHSLWDPAMYDVTQKDAEDFLCSLYIDPFVINTQFGTSPTLEACVKQENIPPLTSEIIAGEAIDFFSADKARTGLLKTAEVTRKHMTFIGDNMSQMYDLITEAAESFNQNNEYSL